MTQEKIWLAIRAEAKDEAQQEPLLVGFLHATILNHTTLASALAFHLANQLEAPTMPAVLLREIISEALENDETVMDAVCHDIEAVTTRDPACPGYSIPFLFFKGFHALQAYRVGHWLWTHGRTVLALALQSKVSQKFGVDIHPGARIGKGILFDHATGIVIGETAVLGNNVSMLHQVTLGGTGKISGDRHPKVEDGVLIGAGATIIGNIRIGEGAKIGASSVVLADVPCHTTAVGVPAQIIGRPTCDQPALEMNHEVPCGKHDIHLGSHI